MTQRYAVVDIGSGKVVNIIDADSASESPSGQIYVPSNTANIGDNYSNGVFTAPTAPAPTIRQQIEILEAMQTARMIRESLQNATNTFPQSSPFSGLTSAQALTSIQSQIVALRAQLS